MRKPLCLALCALLVASATASAQQTFSMATLAPPGSTWMRVFDAANRELRRRTGGQLQMRWYAGGVQGDEAEVVRKIRTGRLDGGAMTAAGLSQIHRPILAFQLPGMFDSPQQFVRARDALRPEVTAAFDSAGFTLLAFGGTGAPRMLSRRTIRVPTDLRAARPWQWRDDSILPALYAEVGATGVPLQVPEVLGAIQTGRVDTVFASPLAAIALQWSAQMQYISERSNSASLGGIVVSRTRFNALSPDHQTAIREVTAQYNILLVRNVTRDDESAAQTLAQRGVQTVQLNDAERAQWVAVFSRVRQRVTGTIADAAWIRRVHDAGRGAP